MCSFHFVGALTLWPEIFFGVQRFRGDVRLRILQNPENFGQMKQTLPSECGVIDGRIIFGCTSFGCTPGNLLEDQDIADL